MDVSEGRETENEINQAMWLDLDFHTFIIHQVDVAVLLLCGSTKEKDRFETDLMQSSVLKISWKILAFRSTDGWSDSRC